MTDKYPDEQHKGKDEIELLTILEYFTLYEDSDTFIFLKIPQQYLLLMVAIM